MRTRDQEPPVIPVRSGDVAAMLSPQNDGNKQAGMITFLRWYFVITVTLLVTAGAFTLLFSVLDVRSPIIGFLTSAVAMTTMHVLIRLTRLT